MDFVIDFNVRVEEEVEGIRHLLGDEVNVASGGEFHVVAAMSGIVILAVLGFFVCF